MANPFVHQVNKYFNYYFNLKLESDQQSMYSKISTYEYSHYKSECPSLV